MKVFFVVNMQRRNRKPPQELLEQFEALFREHGVEHKIAPSHSIEHARELVDEALASGYDTLWVGGGDGTVNVLLNYSIGKGLTYGIVPMGTVNALARSLGIPSLPIEAARYLLGASPKPVDVGRINDRHFLCFASVGFDASVVHYLSEDIKKRFGRLAFLVSGVQAFQKRGTIAPFQIEAAAVESDDKTHPLSETAHSFILSNIENYAGFRLFHKVQPGSGSMELYLFRQRRLWPMLAWCARLGFGPCRSSRLLRYVGHHLVTEFTVKSEAPMFLQIDGEAMHLDDDREFRFTCLPGAVKLLLK